MKSERSYTGKRRFFLHVGHNKKENINLLVYELLFNLKDIYFSLKILLFYKLIASTSNSKNYTNFLVGIRIHTDCIRA